MTTFRNIENSDKRGFKVTVEILEEAEWNTSTAYTLLLTSCFAKREVDLHIDKDGRTSYTRHSGLGLHLLLMETPCKDGQPEEMVSIIDAQLLKWTPDVKVMFF